MAKVLEKLKMKNQKIQSEKQKRKCSVVPLLTMLWASVVLAYDVKSHVAAVTRCDWFDTQNQNKRLKQHLSLFGIVAASIVLNNNSKYLLFSLLFWFCVSHWVSHCILRELQHYWFRFRFQIPDS